MEGKEEYFIGHLWDGGKRDINQDALGFWWMRKKKSHCFLGVICDGIGGLQEGENASTYVLKHIISWFLSEGYKEKRCSVIRYRIQQIFFQIHCELKNYGKEKNIETGTTVTFFIIKGKRYIWGHCGDTRLYHFRNKDIKLVTKDHKNRAGALERAIGVGEWQLLDIGIGRFRKKDKLLLCTDGFYRGVTKEDLKHFMEKEIEDCEKADRMLKLMLQKKQSMGEKDNISAIYFGRGGKSK